MAVVKIALLSECNKQRKVLVGLGIGIGIGKTFQQQYWYWYRQ